MALVIPKLVGGADEFVKQAQQAPVEPIESRARNLVIPSIVGGSQEPVDEPAAPDEVEPAKPLSQIVPEAVESAVETVKSIPTPETGFADIFTGSERIKATPELGTLPEFGVTKESTRNVNLKAAFGMLTTLNPKARLDIIKESLPDAKFETTPDGSTIIEVPTEDGGTKRSVLNRPGLSGQDFADALFQVVTFFPAAKAATFGRTLLQKFGIGAAGAGATEQALQETGVEFFGRQERDPGETATAAVLGGAAELVKPAIQGTREFFRARKAGVERAALGDVAAPVAAAREATEGLEQATGTNVELFQAQQTQTPSDLIKQRILPQLEASSQRASAALERQNVQAFNATNELIRTIAPDQVVETGAARFRDAATRAREVARIARSEAASPIYKQAFRRQRQGRTPPLDMTALQAKIAGIIRGSDASGQVANNLGTVSEKLTGAGGNLQQLHSVKLEIDNLIEGRGDNSLGRTTMRALVDIKNDLVDSMIEQSPSYRAAREEFIRLTPAIEELDNSLVGRISDIPDDQLKNVASKLFDPREINPTVLRNARQVIEDVDPGAWNDIVRVESERRFGALSNFLEEHGTENVSNIPGQIARSLFGNPKNRQVFFSALNREQAQNFRYLETTLNRAMRGRAAGSPTTPFKEALDKMRGVAGVLRDTIFRPVSTIQGVGEQSFFDSRASALAEVMFNPQWRPQMRELRRLDPNSPAAARALTQLFKSVDSEKEEEQ